MKKIIAIALALIMCLGIMSMVAFAAGDKMTVKVVSPADWAETYVYSWNPEQFGTWPGTKVEGGSFELTGAVEGLVISAGNNMPQTHDIKDLTYAAGANKVITVGEVVDGKHTYTISDGAPEPTTTAPTTATTPTTTTVAPTTTTAAPVKDECVLTIKVPSAWTAVAIYTWEPETYGTYPGAAVTKSGSSYSTKIKTSMKNLIITGTKADGTLQKTADIALQQDGNDFTIEVAEDGSYKIIGGTAVIRFKALSKPVATKTAGTASDYRVVGGGAWLGEWNAASDLGRMNEVEKGVFRKNYDNVQPGTYEFKITKDGKWDISYGDGAEGKDNCKFEVSAAGPITVDLTFKNGDVSYIEVYGPGVMPSHGDISMLSVVVLMALASVTAIVLVVNKKKFI